jgi:hypothetical protein
MATFGHASLYLADLERDDLVRIRMAPPGDDLFPVEATFRYVGGGSFDRHEATAAAIAGVARPEGFELLKGIPQPLVITLFRGFLPMIRDVGDKVRQAVRDAVKRESAAHKAAWQKARDPGFDILDVLQQPATAHWLADPPVAAPGTAPQYELQTVDPQAHLRVFEFAPASGRKVPGLIFASLPKDLKPALLDIDADQRLSFLLMVRPILGTYYASSPYPFGINHLWDAGLKYMGLLGLDPILQKYPDQPVGRRKKSGFRDEPTDIDDSSLQHVGLMHQVAAGKKRVAVVMPLLRGGSLGRFADAEFWHRILHEIHSWELRANEFSVIPGEMGPCAIAGFSSGNQLLATWLNQNAGEHFCDEVIQEVYSIDAPVGTHALDQIVDAAQAWAQRGAADKAIRLYNQVGSHEKLAGFKPPGTSFPRAPFVSENGPLRTLVCTPAEWLNRAALDLDPDHRTLWPGGYLGGDKEAHQIINSTSFVDALRRSRFPGL